MLDAQPLFVAADRWVREHEHKKIELARIEYDIARKQKEREELLARVKMLEEVRVFLQELAEVTRDEIMSGLQQVVTLCLQAVFGPDLRFEIEVETKRNTTSVEFFVVDTSGPIPLRRKPESSMGGGVLDTISMGLRFGLQKIINPPPIGPMILDEPAKMVSGDLIGDIGRLLVTLREIFGKQIILITHHYGLHDIVDNAIYVRRVNGISVCEMGNAQALIQQIFGEVPGDDTAAAYATLRAHAAEAASTQEE